MINIPLLRRTLEWATEQHHRKLAGEPSEWDQSHWIAQSNNLSCGTSCCIAGKVVLEAGFQPSLGFYSGLHTCKVQLPDGREGFVDDVAADLLRLTTPESEALFRGDNRIDDLWRIANEVTDGEIEIPAEFL